MAGSIEETLSRIAGVPPTADGLQFTRFVAVASATLYLYDILLTLDLEVELIWSRVSFNLLTILYMLNRYISYILFIIVMHNLPGFHWDLSEAYCKVPVDLIGIMLAYTGWTGITTIRVCAIYRQKTRLVIVLRLLWAGAMATLFAILYLTYEESAPMAYDPETRQCLITTNSPRIKAIPIAPAIYEIILTILTIFKSFDFSDDASDTTLPLLYRVLAREGVAYFAISMMMTLINMICWYLFPGSPVIPFLLFYWGIMSPLMARLVLNLKSAHHVNLSEQSATDGVTASVPFFRSPGQPHHFRGHMHGARFSTGKNSLPDPMHSTTRITHIEEEDQGWNGPAFHVLRTMSAIPLKNMDSDRRLST